MAQSLSKILIHLVFSTKNRRNWIGKPIRDEMHKYIAGILDEWDCMAISIGSVGDHAHILYRQSKNHSVSNIAEQVKCQRALKRYQ